MAACQTNKLILNKQIKSFKILKNNLYQLNLFNTKNTTKIETIDLRIPAHYFKVRAELVSLRFFNTLKIENNTISKTVELSKKGKEEANWFRNTKTYLPQISPLLIQASKDQKTYKLEYLPMVSLSEIYTYGQIDINYWEQIFKSINNVLEDMHDCANELKIKNKININDDIFKSFELEIFKKKTIERLILFSKSKSISYPFEVSLNNNKKISVDKIIDFIFESVIKIKKKYIYSHGDFCLSNILYDSRLSIIKLVDPLGHKEENNFNEMIKSQIYDLTKLAHSLLGFYDLINVGEISAEKFSIKENHISIFCNYTVDVYHEIIYKKASSYKFLKDCSLKEYLPGTVLLFLSMLPLHSDDEKKQMTLLGNAIRIYESLIYL